MQKQVQIPAQKKQLRTKNEMRRKLSACAIQKFNGYELLRNHLQRGERRDFVPIDVVYEPTLDEKKKTIFCFLLRTFISPTTVVWRKFERNKNRWILLVQDSAITATIISLKALKK